MLTEYRKLVFPHGELIKAIAAHDEAGDGSFGGAKVVAARPQDGAEIAVQVDLEAPGEDTLQSVRVDEATLVGALVRYCIDNRYPMPRRGRKTIERHGERLALHVFVDGVDHEVEDKAHYVLL